MDATVVSCIWSSDLAGSQAAATTGSKAADARRAVLADFVLYAFPQ